MLNIDLLKDEPSRASPDDVRELIRLLELARAALPSYGGTQAPSPNGEITDIKSVPRP